jgi:DNA topoisomerase-1
MAKFGPVAVKMDLADAEAKPIYANLRSGMHLEGVSLADALELFKLPRTLGEYEDKTLSIGVGRFGPYVKHDGKFVSLKKDMDPMTITEAEAIVLIHEKREKDANRLIADFPDAGIQVLNGMYGPYIAKDKVNYKIPKGTEAKTLTLDEVLHIIETAPEPKPARKGGFKARKKG